MTVYAQTATTPTKKQAPPNAREIVVAGYQFALGDLGGHVNKEVEIRGQIVRQAPKAAVSKSNQAGPHLAVEAVATVGDRCAN